MYRMSSPITHSRTLAFPFSSESLVSSFLQGYLYQQADMVGYLLLGKNSSFILQERRSKLSNWRISCFFLSFLLRLHFSKERLHFIPFLQIISFTRADFNRKGLQLFSTARNWAGKYDYLSVKYYWSQLANLLKSIRLSSFVSNETNILIFDCLFPTSQ